MVGQGANAPSLREQAEGDGATREAESAGHDVETRLHHGLDLLSRRLHYGLDLLSRRLHYGLDGLSRLLQHGLDGLSHLLHQNGNLVRS